MINRKTKKKRRNYNRCMEKFGVNYEILEQMIKKGAILLDVRSEQEYNEGHLSSAIHLADYEILKKHNIILPNKNAEIIVYCQNGGRSQKVCKKLKKLGYTKIYNLCGGLDKYNYKKR